MIHTLTNNPVAWWGLRSVTGFCFAGLYLVIESWLNERASNENRGLVMGIYTMINLSVHRADDPTKLSLANIATDAQRHTADPDLDMVRRWRAVTRPGGRGQFTAAAPHPKRSPCAARRKSRRHHRPGHQAFLNDPFLRRIRPNPVHPSWTRLKPLGLDLQQMKTHRRARNVARIRCPIPTAASISARSCGKSPEKPA